MKKWYYVLFVIGLYFFNQTFQEFVVVNGILSGLIAGLVIAFLCKLVFSVVSKTVIFLAIVGAIAVFLFSTGYLEMPSFVQDLLGFRDIVMGAASSFLSN